MNTYIIYITYTDGYIDEFEVDAPNRMKAIEIVADLYKVDFDEVTHVKVELKEEE